MAIDRVAPLVLTCALTACMHDFDVFEPGADSGGAGNDATAPDAGGVDANAPDAAAPDSAPGDSASGDAPSDAQATCTDPGAVTYDGHCYFATTASAAWDASRAACVAAGAHLATVASQGEETAIEALAPTKDRWIGLSRPVGSAPRDASYVWITGEPRTYTDWEPGEPNGSGECVRIRPGGRWADNSCATSFVAICERE